MRGLSVNYLSVCSGIEAATAAWHPLGWNPVGFSEIGPFPAHVLHHHYSSGRPRFMPDPGEPGLTDDKCKARTAAIKAVAGLPEQAGGVPNFGDLNRFKEWPNVKALDVLVGGTPCPSFSISGLRQGLADPRGNLCLTFLAAADRYQPEWLIWENVPGVLSSNGGRDYGAFLGALAELGYGFAWRVLDAQFVRVDQFARAVPQKRRRLFVVGNRSDRRRAAAVLFEPKSVCGDSPPGREPQEAADHTQDCAGDGRGRDGLGTGILDVGATAFGVAGNATAVSGQDRVTTCAKRLIFVPETSPTIMARDHKGVASDGYGVGIPLIVEAFDNTGQGRRDQANVAAAARKGDQNGCQYADESMIPVSAFRPNARWAVRSLMPVECERLQGFADDYTLVPFRGKPAIARHRYEALGNSMAVNVMRWLGTRIVMVDRLLVENEKKCGPAC